VCLSNSACVERRALVIKLVTEEFCTREAISWRCRSSRYCSFINIILSSLFGCYFVITVITVIMTLSVMCTQSSTVSLHGQIFRFTEIVITKVKLPRSFTFSVVSIAAKKQKFFPMYQHCAIRFLFNKWKHLHIIYPTFCGWNFKT
jgi:hypothetical protein